MPKRRAVVAVVIEGRSCSGIEQGFYNFETTVDGKPGQLRVSEDVAFDFLGVWTRNQALCLDILRSHRAELAENLAFKLRRAGHTADNGLYSLTLRDMERMRSKTPKRPPAAPPIEDIDRPRREVTTYYR